MAKTLKLTWWNECDLGNIYYAGGYKNIFYYETEIGKPSYVVDEETEKNGDAVDVILSQQRVKEYQFEVYVPEYVADSLVDMALHDNIQLQTTDGLFNSLIRNVEVIPSWEEISNDCMATVIIKFQVDDQLVKNACCTPLSVLGCLVICANVKGFATNHSLDLVEGGYYMQAINLGVVLQWTAGGFVVFPCTSNYVYSIDNLQYMYWNGSLWVEAPGITAVNYALEYLNVILTGTALPNTFIQAYISTDNITYITSGNPVTATEFATGLHIHVPGGYIYAKVYMYNHNCQYQYSNKVSV